jgi:hypothetical protein
MGKVFTTAASVQCGHGGAVAAGALKGPARLTVAGKAVLRATDLAGVALQAGCSQTKTNSAEKPCLVIVAASGTSASKLTVGGTPVLAEKLGGSTDGAPINTALTGSAGQSILTAS